MTEAVAAGISELWQAELEEVEAVDIAAAERPGSAVADTAHRLAGCMTSETILLLLRDGCEGGLDMR